MRPGGALAAAGFPGCSGANGHDTAARARRAPNSARIIAGAFQPTMAYLTAGTRASYTSGGSGASRAPRTAGDVTAGPAHASYVPVSYAPCAERRCF